MTPEELALRTLEVQQIQVWITGAAIVLGPLVGVLFTLWSQRRKEKKDAKVKVLMTLIGERKYYVSKDVARALNSVDVVFADEPNIRTLWHKYYALTSQPYGQERDHAWLELLSAMAVSAGYPKLSQVDLDKFYMPQGHVDDHDLARNVQHELLRVLQGTEGLLAKQRQQSATQPPDQAG